MSSSNFQTQLCSITTSTKSTHVITICRCGCTCYVHACTCARNIIYIRDGRKTIDIIEYNWLVPIGWENDHEWTTYTQKGQLEQTTFIA